MKKEEWGLLTVAALLATFVFPPYFIQILAISGLTSLAYAAKPREKVDSLQRLVEFEQEFRIGHDCEERNEWDRAREVYQGLAEKYRGDPSIQQIALQRIQYVEERAGRPPA